MNQTPSPMRAALLGLAVIAATTTVSHDADAVQPQRFTHTAEADFEPGTFEGTVVTDLGDLELASTSELLAELPPEYTVVYDVAEWNGDTYIAVGPEAAVFKIGDEIAQTEDANDEEADVETLEGEENEEAEDAEQPQRKLIEVATFPGEQAFKLLPVDDGISVALSGTPSRVVVIDATGAANTALELPDVRYLWDVVFLNETAGAIVATGPEGVVLKVEMNDDGLVASTLLDTPQANILTLAATPDDDGLTFPVYAGTDTDGLIYRLNEDGSSAAIYDAAEPEVAALVVATDGTLYAGTADADQARPGRMDGANEEDTGRPDTDTPDGETPDAGDAPDDEPLPVEPDPEPMQADAEGVVDADAAAAAEDRDAEAAATAEDTDDPGEATDDLTDEADTGDDALADGETVDVSPEQYDALREEVRKRLETARKTGKVAAGGTKAAKSAKATRPRAAGTPEASAKEGNAVYKIAPDGLVTEPFRESVMILGLHLDEATDRLLIATGSEGQLYEVKLGDHETATLEDLDAEQVIALHTGEDALVFGTANPATLRTLAAPASAPGDATGTYTSAALDAEQVSLWGKLLIVLETVAGDVVVETRTGNVADPDAAAWSPWSPAIAIEPDPEQGLKTTSAGMGGMDMGMAETGEKLKNSDAHNPQLSARTSEQLANSVTTAGTVLYRLNSHPARFIQYRITLTAKGEHVPVINRVELPYIRPNLPPSVTSLTVAYGDTPEDPDEPTPTIVNVEWEAEDANDDRLQYDIQARPAGEKGWLIVAEDLEDTSHEWDTKALPDGRYTVRVIANDRLNNPKGSAKAASRRSEPVIIDNTPPSLNFGPSGHIIPKPGLFEGFAKDIASPIAAVEYRVAADDPWRPALPDDLIYDSTNEAFSFTLPRLASGGHVLSVRARDARGNTHYASRFITVP